MLQYTNTCTQKRLPEGKWTFRCSWRGGLLLDAVAAIAEEVIQRQVRIVDHVTTGRTSVFEIAAKLYGDRKRAEEILQNNPQLRPLFIPPGTVFRVLVR